MTSFGVPITAAALLLAALACSTDLRSRRIPNALVLSGLIAGLVLNSHVAGLAGVGASLAGAGLGLAMFLPFLLLGGMGGGDVKLMAALGSLVGPAGVVRLALATAILGGVLALARVLWEGRLRETLQGIAGLLWLWASTGLRPSPDLHLGNPATIRVPYAVPIAAGTLLVTLGRWS